MTENGFRRPPDAVDMAAEERGIRRGTTLATVATLIGFVAAYNIAPSVTALPVTLPERLAFAALCWAVPGFILLVAIMIVSTTRRFSPSDIGGQAAGPPSDALAIKAAFLQNTLEQTVLAAGFYFALAAVAGGPWLSLLPVAVVLFAVGRVLFYIGYPRGAGGRALGMGLTMVPSAMGYPLVAALFIFAG